jgi:hypothetical protein
MAIQYGFGASVSSGLIFAYDTIDTVNSYLGEPTTNHIYHQNARLDGSYESYMPESGTGNIAANHPGAIRVFNTNGGDISYYLNTGINTANSGVEWYNTRHAYWIFDTIIQRPVVRMYNETGVWQAKYFGTGLASLNSIGIIAGTLYTISWLQYVENLDRAAHVGIYSYSPTRGYNDFHDGLQNGYNTEVNTWQRVSITFMAKDYGQLGSGPTMYFYGHAVGAGELRIADVQLEVKPHATQYSSAYTRSATQGLLPLAGNSTINISTVSFDANAQIIFDGTNDYGQTGVFLPNITDKTYEAVTRVYDINHQAGGVIGIMGESGEPFDTIVYNETGQGWGFGSTGFERTAWSGVKETTTGFVHLVATYSNYSYKLYRNGQLILTTTAYPILNYNFNSVIIFGKRHGATTGPYNGEIPVAKIYNRVLSQAEVTQNFKKYQTRFGLA